MHYSRSCVDAPLLDLFPRLILWLFSQLEAIQARAQEALRTLGDLLAADKGNQPTLTADMQVAAEAAKGDNSHEEALASQAAAAAAAACIGTRETPPLLEGSPFAEAPHPAAAALVASELQQLLPPLLKELADWTAKTRLRASHTLLGTLWLAGPAATSHFDVLLPPFLRGVEDDDEMVMPATCAVIEHPYLHIPPVCPHVTHRRAHISPACAHATLCTCHPLTCSHDTCMCTWHMHSDSPPASFYAIFKSLNGIFAYHLHLHFVCQLHVHMQLTCPYETHMSIRHSHVYVPVTRPYATQRSMSLHIVCAGAAVGPPLHLCGGMQMRAFRVPAAHPRTALNSRPLRC